MKLFLRRTAALLAAVFFAAPACAQDAVLTADEIAAAVHSVDLVLDWQCRQKINRLVAGPETRLPAVDTSGLPPKADLRDMDGRNFHKWLFCRTPRSGQSSQF